MAARGARRSSPGSCRQLGFRVRARVRPHSEWVAAFVQRLRELGWIEGRTVTIEYRWSEGRAERFAEIAAEFVRLKVDVIVTSGTPQVLAAKQATSVIPIVFATAGDPVGNGLVASLARPGGNVTGLSLQSTDIGWQAARTLARGCSQSPPVGDLWPMSVIPSPSLEMGEAHAAARALGLEVATFEIRRAEDIAPAFEALKGRADALYVCSDALVNANRIRINTLALGARLPTMHGYRELRRSGRSDVLWTKLPGPVPALRRLCRQDSARGRSRARSRSSSRPSLISSSISRPPRLLGLDNPADAARPRRRGDRMMKRREFITLLGGAAAAWPIAARAQQAGKIPRIGWIVLGSPAGSVADVFSYYDSFRAGLGDVGYVEGSNIILVARSAEGVPERLPSLVDELLREIVSVIVSPGPAIRVVREKIKSIPVVFAFSGDPVAAGFVDTLSHGKENLTGLSYMAVELNGKRLDLMKALLPTAPVASVVFAPAPADGAG